jgi:hypothetical protein
MGCRGASGRVQSTEPGGFRSEAALNKFEFLQQSFDIDKRATVEQALFRALPPRKDSLLQGPGPKIAGCSNKGFQNNVSPTEGLRLLYARLCGLSWIGLLLFLTPSLLEPGRSGHPFSENGVISRNHGARRGSYQSSASWSSPVWRIHCQTADGIDPLDKGQSSRPLQLQA